MRHVNVLYTFDNNYAPMCGVSLTSLFMNSRDVDEITVYLVTIDLSEENKSKFEELGRQFGREMLIVDGAPYVEKIKQLGFKPFHTVYLTNLKLILGDYIRADADKVVFIDCDTLVTGSVGRFVEYDMGDKCIAMARDLMNEFRVPALKYKYHNCGSAVFDMKNWAEGNWTDKLVAYARKENKRFFSAEEYLLNMVCGESTYELPMKFNFLAVHRAIPDKAFFRVLRYDEATRSNLREAHDEPIMLHTHALFGSHPWNVGSQHPDRQLFLHYLELSPWKDHEFAPAKDSFIIRAEAVLYRCLPKTLFFLIFCALQKITHARSLKTLREEDLREQQENRKEKTQ